MSDDPKVHPEAGEKKALISREVAAVKANFADALRRLGEGPSAPSAPQ